MPEDHIPQLYDRVGQVEKDIVGLTEQVGTIRDQLGTVASGVNTLLARERDGQKTPWPALALSVTVVLAGVGGMFSFYDRDVARIDKDTAKQFRSVEKTVDRHESDLDQRAYLANAFDTWRSEQRAMERRVDELEASDAYQRGLRDGRAEVE